MKLSIVTVVFNDKRVKDAIDSILAQKLDAELELVVIDGGSTDGTLELLQSYQGQIHVLVSEPDKGIYDAMNKGLQRASGDIIGTLNADDYYFNDGVLAKVAKAFQESSAKICYGDLVYVKKDDSSVIARYWRSCAYRDGLFQRGWMPPHPTFFVRREIYEELGYFDLNYRLAADCDLTMRFLAKHQVPSVHIPEIMVTMRLGGATNVSIQNIFDCNMEVIRVCRKNGLRIPPWYILVKGFSRILQFFQKPPESGRVSR